MYRLFFISVAAIFLMFTGCGPSSEITNSWVKPGGNTAPMESVLVMGIVGDGNRELRQRMETALVEQLRTTGYTARSSFAEYGPKMFDVKDEQAALQRMKDANTDAVLTVVLLDKNKERYYVPGRVQYTPYATYYNRFWGYYTTLYDRTYTPGYYATNTELFWESNLYNAQTGELIYSVQTRSFNPNSSEDLAREYAQLIVQDMVKNNALRGRAATRS